MDYVNREDLKEIFFIIICIFGGAALLVAMMAWAVFLAKIFIFSQFNF